MLLYLLRKDVINADLPRWIARGLLQLGLQQMRHYQSIGYLQNKPDTHADLGELVTGAKPGRETDQEITMAANLDMALEDMTVAKLIFSRAKAVDIDRWLDL